MQIKDSVELPVEGWGPGVWIFFLPWAAGVLLRLNSQDLETHSYLGLVGSL